MAASNTDKFREATSGTRPESAYLTSPKTVGSTSISVSTTTGWATATGTDFIIYRKNTDNTIVPGSLTTWVGVVSGTTINNMVLKAGTEPVGGYASGEQSVVIATPTAAWNKDFIDGILTQHNQDGTHAAITATSLSTTASVTAGNGLTVSTGSVALPNNSIDGNELSTSAITLGYASITSAFSTASTTSTQVTGLTLTVTVPAGGRRVRITGFAPFIYNTTSGNVSTMEIWDGAVVSGTQLSRVQAYSPANSTGAPGTVSAVVTPAAGSKTYNIALRASGATSFIDAGATYPAYILVELI